MSKTYSQLYFHCVWSVKDRESFITPNFEARLYQYLCAIAKNLGQRVLCINGIPDHIHLAVGLQPSIAPSTFVQKMKANSSKWVNENGLLRQRFSWQRGGGVFTIGAKGLPELIKYINNQKEHHRSRTFKEEYMSLLKAYEVPFQVEYLPEFFDT